MGSPTGNISHKRWTRKRDAKYANKKDNVLSHIIIDWELLGEVLNKAVNRPAKPADYNAGHYDGENRESESVFLNAGEIFVKVIEGIVFLRVSVHGL